MSEVRRTGYLLVLIIFSALVISYLWKAPAGAKIRALPPSVAPLCVSGFLAHPGFVSSAALQALGTAQVIDREYKAADGFTINFALIRGTDRDALHDPRSCLVGAGGRIDNDHLERLPGTTLQVRSCDVNFGGENGSKADIVYYYFTQQGSISSVTAIRMRLLSYAFLFRREEPIYFIRFVTPVPVDADVVQRRAIHNRLTEFASDMWRIIGPTLMTRGNHS